MTSGIVLQGGILAKSFIIDDFRDVQHEPERAKSFIIDDFRDVQHEPERENTRNIG